MYHAMEMLFEDTELHVFNQRILHKGMSAQERIKEHSSVMEDLKPIMRWISKVTVLTTDKFLEEYPEHPGIQALKDSFEKDPIGASRYLMYSVILPANKLNKMIPLSPKKVVMSSPDPFGFLAGCWGLLYGVPEFIVVDIAKDYYNNCTY